MKTLRDYIDLIESNEQGVDEGLEKFNTDLMKPGFRWSEEINGITYLVRTQWDNMPEVIARVNNREVGRATFIDHHTRSGLESVSTYVSPKWQGHGIAKNMYAVIRMLGANIQPSATQTAMGKDMWAKWKKGGDTKHLTSMNAKMDQQGVAEGDLNELAPSSGEGGNGPFDYGSAIIEIGQNFVDNYADSAAGEDAADIIQVGKTFMSAGMTKGISALFALDTQVYDHVLDELSSLGFNVDLDIISKRRAPTLDRDAQNALRAVQAKWDAQPGQVYLVTGYVEGGYSQGKIKATSPEAAIQQFIANTGEKFNKIDVKPYPGVAEKGKSRDGE